MEPEGGVERQRHICRARGWSGKATARGVTANTSFWIGQEAERTMSWEVLGGRAVGLLVVEAGITANTSFRIWLLAAGELIHDAGT